MSAVTNALDAFQQTLDDLGNDDHSVGLCDCEDRRLLAEARTAHDDLVAALRQLIAWEDDPLAKIDDVIATARAALAKAGVA